MIFILILNRDNATPFPAFFSRVNERLSCPIESMVLVMVLSLAFGAITLGSKTAFLDLVCFLTAVQRLS
jgi:choline transport protein